MLSSNTPSLTQPRSSTQNSSLVFTEISIRILLLLPPPLPRPLHPHTSLHTLHFNSHLHSLLSPTIRLLISSPCPSSSSHTPLPSTNSSSSPPVVSLTTLSTPPSSLLPPPSSSSSDNLVYFPPSLCPFTTIAWTPSFTRLLVLAARCWVMGEAWLIVGETGSGKMMVGQLLCALEMAKDEEEKHKRAMPRWQREEERKEREAE